MSERPVQLGFDARLAGPRHAGIGRYSEQLLQRLLLRETVQRRKLQWHVFVSADHGMIWLETLAKKQKNISLHIVAYKHYSVAEQTLWLKTLNSFQLDLLHVPHFNVPLLYRRPYIVTIHDLLWHQHRDAQATTLPGWLHRLKYTAYRIVSEQAIQRAKAVLVPSQTVAKEVLKATGRVPNIFVTYEGVSEPYRSATVKKTPAEKNRIIYTGSLYPHKNITVILKALRLLPQLRLSIASARSVFSDRVLAQAQRMGVAHQVNFLGYVSDEELIDLYRNSLAVVQPSVSEGFGLTGLEALASGVALVVSDTAIFHEIYQEQALYCAAHDSVEWARTLQNVLTAPLTFSQRSANQAHALRFSWDAMEDETWDVYKQTLTTIWQDADSEKS